MIPASGNFDIFEYIKQVFLAEHLDPFKNQSFKNLTLVTCLTQDQQAKNNMKSIEAQKSSKFKTIFANLKRNFFVLDDSLNPNISTLNFIFFLTFFKEIRILLKVKGEDILNDNKSNIIKFFNYLDRGLGEKNNGTTDELIQSMALLVEQNNVKQVQKYMDQLGKVPKDKLGSQGKKLLESVLKNRKIIKSSSSLNCDRLVEQSRKIVNQPFKSEKKKILTLFENIKFVKKEQIKERIFKDIITKSKEFLQTIKQAIRNIQIFEIDIQIRMKALSQQILSKNPFRYDTPHGQKLNNVDHFALQSAWYCLAQFCQLDQQFQKKNYLKDEQLDQEINPQDIMNLSISGKIVETFFSENTVFHEQSMIEMARIFHITFFMFQGLEPAFKFNIRKQEAGNIKELHQIIEGLVVDYFLDALLMNIISLVNKQNQYIKYSSPLKILSLVQDIKNLRDLLTRISFEKREPYKKFAERIKQRLGSINAAFVFSSWRLYQIYFKKYWSVEQCNSFVLELYRIFMNKDYAQDLEIGDKKMAKLIFKKLSQYLGDYCVEQKNFFTGKNFFQNANLYWKQIQSINSILDNYLDEQSFKSFDEIVELIKLLALFGLFEEARKWCYKFLDVLDEDSNSDIIALLEQISDYEVIQNTLIRDQISKLKTKRDLITVDQSTFNKLYNELAKQDWLNGD